MAKKATLLKRALKLKLDVTEKSTVPEITAALEAHEKKTAKTPTQVKSERPQEQKAPTEPTATETAVESASEPQFTLKDILVLYNSVKPSRRRWIQNRNLLRNQWKELFQMLEKASGRDGQKAVLYDYNWHHIVQKDETQGLADLPREEITIVAEGGASVVDTSEKDLEISRLKNELEQSEAHVATLHAQIAAQVNDTQAQLEAAEIAANGHVLAEDEPLPGETSTVTEQPSESTTTQKESEATETEKATGSTTA